MRLGQRTYSLHGICGIVFHSQWDNQLHSQSTTACHYSRTLCQRTTSDLTVFSFYIPSIPIDASCSFLKDSKKQASYLPLTVRLLGHYLLASHGIDWFC
jgi:hypothetical protein